MSTMTLAVPKDLKNQMDKIKIINWSAVAREAFEEKIQKLKLLESLTKGSKLTEKHVEEISAKIKKEIAKAHE